MQQCGANEMHPGMLDPQLKLIARSACLCIVFLSYAPYSTAVSSVLSDPRDMRPGDVVNSIPSVPKPSARRL